MYVQLQEPRLTHFFLEMQSPTNSRDNRTLQSVPILSIMFLPVTLLMMSIVPHDTRTAPLARKAIASINTIPAAGRGTHLPISMV